MDKCKICEYWEPADEELGQSVTDYLQASDLSALCDVHAEDVRIILEEFPRMGRSKAIEFYIDCELDGSQSRGELPDPSEYFTKEDDGPGGV